MTLIKKLINEHNQVVQYTEESPYKDGFLAGMRMAIDIAQKDNGWISVDDELPKEFETVLLFGKKYNGEPLITKGHLIQSLVDEFGVEEGFSVPIFITHWQSLPNPPKER